jgi:hypothetical protein
MGRARVFSGPLLPGTRSVREVNRRPKKAAVKPVTFVSVPKAPKPTFNSQVKKIFNRQIETKMKVVRICDETDIPGAGLQDVAGAVGHKPGLVFTNLFDTIFLSQGTTQEARIGNKVSNAYLTVTGVITSDPFDETHNPSPLPFEVHMVAYRRRKSIQNDYSQLKSLPANQVGEINHTLINTTYPFNKDAYEIIKHRVFTLRPLAGDHTHNLINGQNASNVPMFRRFRQSLKINKKLFFQDGTQVPSNSWVGVAFYVINPDGSELHVPGVSHPSQFQVRAKLSMDACLKYKDA